MPVVCPLEKLELADEHWLQPPTVRHLRFGESLTPAAASRLRKIDERAQVDFKRSEALVQAGPQRRSESIARAGHVDEIALLVIPENHGVERPRAERVAADHELLSLVDAHLHPGARSLAGLVSTVATFRHQSFQSLRL